MGSGGSLTPQQHTFFVSTGIQPEFLGIQLATPAYFSCFVSYGQPDAELAERIHNDLKQLDVPSWMYQFDKTIGRRTWQEITLKRQEAGKVIVLCSAPALVRDGVLKEIEEQIDEDPEKLIPISVDNLWTQPGFVVKRGQRDLKPFLFDGILCQLLGGGELRFRVSKPSQSSQELASGGRFLCQSVTCW